MKTQKPKRIKQPYRPTTTNRKNAFVPTQRQPVFGDAGVQPGFNPDGTYSSSVTVRRGAGGRASIKRSGLEFVQKMDKKYAALTKEALSRRYVRIDKEVEMLYKQGSIDNISPYKMTPDDIKVFLEYRWSLGHSNSEMEHEIAALKNLFGYIDNDAVERCLKMHPDLKPEKIISRLPSLDDKVVTMVFDAAERVDPSDWIKSVSYGVTSFAIATGMRSKELRMCNIRDIDMSGPQWSVIVLHPKGEGKYGKPRPVMIDPEAYPCIERYLYARLDYLKRTGRDDPSLFPGGMSEDGHLQSNTIRKYVDNVCIDLGVDFNLRDCRRTYGQRMLNAGGDLPTVSKMLGHASVVTTEGFYCSMEQTEALNKAAEVFALKMSAGVKKDKDLEQMPKGFVIRGTSPQLTTVNGGDS